MAIKIGTVTCLKSDDIETTPDDRQQKIELIDGVAVLDLGRFEDGDVFKFSASFRKSDWETIKGYWSNRVKVPVVVHDGTVYENCRVVVTSWTKKRKFPGIIDTKIEIWRV